MIGLSFREYRDEAIFVPQLDVMPVDKLASHRGVFVVFRLNNLGRV